MADLKISQFVDGGSVQTNDEIATNRAGVNTKVFVGSAASMDVGSGVGDLVMFGDDGVGNTQYPSGNGSLITNVSSSTITVTDAASDPSMFVLLVGSATGSLSAMTDAGIAYNASTNVLSTNLTTGNSGLTIGSSVPFSDAAGVLTLQNVDGLDATTETTIEAAIDTLPNLTSIQGHSISIAAPLTVPADPNGDRLFFWDDSTGLTAWLDLGAGLAISGTTINTTGGSGPTVTDWVAYTPTFSGIGTPTNVYVKSRRVGDTLEIQGRFTVGTLGSAEARVAIGFNGTANNVTSSSTKFGSGTNLVGYCARSSVIASGLTTLCALSQQYVTFGYNSLAGGSGLSSVIGTNFTSPGDTVSFFAAIPIQGW